MELILFALVTIGMTNILVHGKILDDNHLGWRTWLKRQIGKKYEDVLECYECVGFWCGMLSGAYFLSCLPWNFFFYGFAGAGIMHAYTYVMDLIESKTDYEVNYEEDEQATGT